MGLRTEGETQRRPGQELIVSLGLAKHLISARYRPEVPSNGASALAIGKNVMVALLSVSAQLILKQSM